MALADRAYRWATNYLPLVMPLLRTAMYKRYDGSTAVHVDAGRLFSFDLIFSGKTWWFVTSERDPRSRYRPPQKLHRSPGRVALNVAQIAYWNGWAPLDEELEISEQIHYLPDTSFTDLDRYRADLLARSAYHFVYLVATDELRPNLRPDEQFYAKQMLAQFDEQLDSVGLTTRSWSLREVGRPI